MRLGLSNKKDQGTIHIPVDLIAFRKLSVIGSFGRVAMSVITSF